MIEELKIYFIEECNTSTLEFKYKSYPDLSGMTNNQLWNHANDYGYKEQRQIFHDCYYNSLFYDYYLADYRKIVLYHNSHFDWKIYKPTSEYDALIQYINQCDLSYNDLLDDVSYTNPHYSLVAECPNYDYQTFPFAYGAGQWSSGFFGVIVPCKSILKRVYFMYLYDGYENYETSEFLDVYDFNSSSVRIKMDLYINGIMSDYYVEETLDASKNMLGALFKKKNINGPTISIDYDEIIIEENSVISWFCSDLLSQTTNREYTNYPYNPARNRFIMILEPYNTRYVSNPNIDLETIKSDIEMNQYNISLKQNKLNAGNNIKIVDNIISVVGVSGVESNFYYVNQLRNDVDSSFVEINDLITNITITIDIDLSNSVYDLSSSVEALYLDVSNLNISKQPNINEGDLSISDTSGLELALSSKQPNINTGDLSISDTSGLELSLSTKQPNIHEGDLSISDTSGLELTLSSKQPTIHEGDLLISDTSGLELALSSKQPNIHEGDLSISDTSGLELALSSKQSTINEGDLSISDTSGLELALSIIDTSFGEVNSALSIIDTSFGEVNSALSIIDSSFGEVNSTLDTKQKSLNNTIDVSINNLTLDNNLHVKGNISLDGSFNLNDVIFNNTTVNNEIVISTQLDISNQGTGPALKVSQFGNGDNNSVALFNAGSEGDALLIDSSGEVTIYKDMFVEGTIRTENIVMSSDRRLKTNIEDISGIDNIRKLQPKQYIKYNKKEIGFIANDILDIEDISFVVSKSREYYALNYNSLFTLAIQSIKDLDEELKKKNDSFEKRLEELEKLYLSTNNS